MSLQVCHCCGWSKVTTHQGLRIHQGKKGCTPKGARTAETQQEQCQWGYWGFPNVQTDVKLEISTSTNTDKANYYSELSLQVCHCGWRKMTTYHGLRTHQGIMGCTAKVMKREQYVWKNEWEAEVDRNYPPAKKEHLAETQRTTSDTMFAAATVTIRDEYKSPSAVSQNSSRRATQSSHQLQDFSLVPQIHRPVRDHSTPAYPGNVVKPKERKIKNPSLSQNPDRRSRDLYTQLYAATTATIKEEPESPFARQQPSSRRATNSKSGHQLQELSALSQNTDRRSVDESWSIDSDTELYAAPAATIKEEPESPFALQELPSRRATKTNSGHRLQDFSADGQVNRLVREPPANPPLFTVGRPKVKDGKGTKMRSVARKLPSTSLPVPVVQPKEKKRDNHWTLSENVPVSPNINLQATTTTVEEPRSSFQTTWGSFKKDSGTNAGHQLQDISSSEQVDRSIRENPKTPPPIQPKKKESPSFNSTQERIKSELQKKIQMREEKMNEISEVEAVCESIPDSTSTNARTDFATPQNEDPTSLNEATRPDCSTSMKVKELAQMFSAVQETAVQPEEEKDRQSKNVPASPVINPQTTAMEELRSPFTTPQRSLWKDTNIHADHQLQDISEQMERSVRENPKTPPPVQPKKKDSPLFKVKQERIQSESQQKIQTREEKRAEIRPAEAAREVKELAQMFSAVQETAVQPEEEKDREEQKQSKNVPASPVINPQTTAMEELRSPFTTPQRSLWKDTNIHADHQLQDISEQMERSVRENPKTPPPVQPKKKDSPLFKVKQERIQSESQQKIQTREEKRAEIRPAEAAREVKELAQMFSAVQETAVQPEETDREEQELSQNQPVSPIINSQTTTTTTTEEPRSPFTTPQRSLRKDTNIHADHQLQDISEQMERSVRENPKTPPPVQPKKKDSPLFKVKQERIQSESQQKIQTREEKRAEIRPAEAAREVKELAQMFSAVQETAVQPEETDREEQELSQNQPVSPIINSQTTTTTTTTTEEPRSPFTTPRRSLPKDTKTHADHRLQDFSERADGSVRENPKTPPPVQPKKKESPLFKAAQRRIQSELQQKIQMTEEKMSETRPVETTCESISDSTTTNTQTDSAPEETSQKEDQTSLCGAAQPGLSTGMTVKELAQMFSAVQETAVQPEEEKDREEQKQSKNVPASPVINPQTTAMEELRSPFTTPQRSLRKDTNIHADHELQDISEQMERSVRENPKTPPPVQPKKKHSPLFKVPQERIQSESQQKIQMREEKRGEIRPAEAARERVPDSASGNTQTDTAASQKEDPTSLYEAEQPDFSTCMKVKELARMFSAPAPVQPKDKDREERKLSQVKLLAQRFSTTTAQETAVQPKGKATKPPKLLQKFPDSKSATINRNSQAATLPLEDLPKPSCDSSEPSGFSAAVKVKDLARMFSTAARQEKPVQPRDNQREEQKPAQVKLLIQKLSTPMAQKTATSRPDEKDKENQKPSKWT